MAEIKELIANINPSYKDESGKPKSLSTYKITTQSDITQLEPIYFWILDFIQDAGIDLKKITDNFMASPGSGQFQDFSQRQTGFMAKAGEYLGAINQVTKSILNLIYDLKEFEIRLKQYEYAKSEDKDKREEGLLAIKNIWLDNVDMKRGNGSIHQMAYQMGFTTLREAFLVANSKEDIEKMAAKDGIINDSVKRILIPRISEFLIWKDLSEKELKKRYAIEKNYLKSQVETLKMYTQWARPFLKALKDLKMKGFENDPSMVAAFSTSKFQLTLYGKKDSKKIPKEYENKRKYYSVYVIDMEYRGHVGQKVDQKGNYGFGFGGRVDMTFDCYCLNSDEIKLLDEELAKTDIVDGIKFLEDTTEDTLKQFEEDINHFVFDDETKKEDKKEEKKKQDDTNPFAALFSGIGNLIKWDFASNKKKKEVKEVKDIPKDDFVEAKAREETAEATKAFLYAVYDVYKKAHGMASSPENFEN